MLLVSTFCILVPSLIEKKNNKIGPFHFINEYIGTWSYRKKKKKDHDNC